MEYNNFISTIKTYQTNRITAIHIPHLKILLIEDNSILQTVFSEFLETLNCTNVDIATTGKQALSLYEKHKYALILLDIGLPDIDGIEVCKRIRKKEDHTPVVAITAYETAEQECRQAGFNDFALKPVLLEKMDYLVKRWILSAL
jgi:CheY-like chemotaxis protein